ncbi:hypothetical protein D3C72_1953480 [compost metagenome]
MLAQQFRDRQLDLGAPGFDAGKIGRLVDTPAYQQAHHDQNRAGQERQAPSPGQEVLFGQTGHQREGADRQ